VLSKDKTCDKIHNIGYIPNLNDKSCLRLGHHGVTHTWKLESDVHYNKIDYYHRLYANYVNANAPTLMLISAYIQVDANNYISAVTFVATDSI
jgi:hypothetical protein